MFYRQQLSFNSDTYGKIMIIYYDNLIIQGDNNILRTMA